MIDQATSYMFPPLRRDTSQIGQNDRFTPEKAAYYSAKIECLLNGEERFLAQIKEKNLTGLCSDSGDDCLGTEGEGIKCRAGKCSFWVTWQGKLLPCGMVYTETGNFHTVPQYRCKMAHEYINACLQLETEIRKRGVSNNEK